MSRLTILAVSLLIAAHFGITPAAYTQDLDGFQQETTPPQPVIKTDQKQSDKAKTETAKTKTSKPVKKTTPHNKTVVVKNPNKWAKQPAAKLVKATAKPTPKPTPSPIGSGTGQTKPLSDFELAKYQYCGSDRDCTVAVNGCCDCANGGQEVGVNKERLRDFQKRFDCLYAQCSHEPANPPCFNGVVSCLDHRCQYFDDAKR